MFAELRRALTPFRNGSTNRPPNAEVNIQASPDSWSNQVYSKTDQATWSALMDDINPYAGSLVKIMADPRVMPQFKEMAFEMISSHGWQELPFTLNERLREEGSCFHQLGPDEFKSLSPEYRERLGIRLLNRLTPLDGVPPDSLREAYQDHVAGRRLIPFVSRELGVAIARNYSLLDVIDLSVMRLEPTSRYPLTPPSMVIDFLNDASIPLDIRKIVLDRFADAVAPSGSNKGESEGEEQDRQAKVFPEKSLLALLVRVGRFGWSGAERSDFDHEVLRALERNPAAAKSITEDDFISLASGTNSGGKAQNSLANILISSWRQRELYDSKLLDPNSQHGKVFFAAVGNDEVLLGKIQELRALGEIESAERAKQAVESRHNAAVEWNGIIQRLM